MTSTRRQFLGRVGAGSLALGGFAALSTTARAADTVNVTELMKPGPLGDKTMGDPKSSKVIVEYASLTCTHCKHFHDTTWKPFRTNYLDNNKAYFVLRDFPLDPLATAAVMLCHAAPNNAFFPMVDLLFDTQEKWAFVDDPVADLLGIAKQVGFTQDSFELTLKNQALLDGVNAVKDRGAKVFGVDATPTFFINGAKNPGALTIEEMDKLLA